MNLEAFQNWTKESKLRIEKDLIYVVIAVVGAMTFPHDGAVIILTVIENQCSSVSQGPIFLSRHRAVIEKFRKMSPWLKELVTYSPQTMIWKKKFHPSDQKLERKCHHSTMKNPRYTDGTPYEESRSQNNFRKNKGIKRLIITFKIMILSLR